MIHLACQKAFTLLAVTTRQSWFAALRKCEALNEARNGARHRSRPTLGLVTPLRIIQNSSISFKSAATVGIHERERSNS